MRSIPYSLLSIALVIFSQAVFRRAAVSSSHCLVNGNVHIFIQESYASVGFRSVDAVRVIASHWKMVKRDAIANAVVRSVNFVSDYFESVLDVYRKDVEAQKDIFKLSLYITFFPQLIAGPILKYHDVEQEIEKRHETLDHFIYGIRRFTLGLGKKVIIANSLGYVADQIFSTPAGMVSHTTAWGGAIA